MLTRTPSCNVHGHVKDCTVHISCYIWYIWFGPSMAPPSRPSSYRASLAFVLPASAPPAPPIIHPQLWYRHPRGVALLVLRHPAEASVVGIVDEDHCRPPRNPNLKYLAPPPPLALIYRPTVAPLLARPTTPSPPPSPSPPLPTLV
jgi:hypothetical protein